MASPTSAQPTDQAGSGESPNQAVEAAARFLESGKIEDAVALCEDILLRFPNQPDALHLLSGIYLHREEPAIAVALLEEAVGEDPENPEFITNLAIAQQSAGANDAAEKSFRRAIGLNPGHVSAHLCFGHYLSAQDRREEAADIYRDAISAYPLSIEAHLALARLYKQQGKFDECIAAHDAALAAVGKEAELYVARGVAQWEIGRRDQAVADFEQALATDPECADAHGNLAKAALMRDDETGALEHFRQAQMFAPDDIDIKRNLGNLLLQQEDFTAAEQIFRDLLAIEPETAYTHRKLAMILRRAGKRGEAMDHLDAALKFTPDDATLHYSRALMASELGRTDEAIDFLNKAEELAPMRLDVGLPRGALLLSLGQWKPAWKDYLGRVQLDQLRARAIRAGPGTHYHREPLPGSIDGKRIAVESEGNISDDLFFLRFLPRLRMSGAHVIYLAEPVLTDMMRRNHIADEIAVMEDKSENIHLRMIQGDLPYILGIDQSDRDPTPAAARLTATAEAAEAMRGMLADFGPKPYIGVTWRGGGDGAAGHKTPGTELARVLEGMDATVISLQRNPDQAEFEAFARIMGRKLHDAGDANDDLEKTLALMAELHDYICVENANVHFRAAVGRASRILVSVQADFYWMAEGDESPWFPGSRIYRQPRPDDWRTPLDALADDLKKAFPKS